eukprot:IDg7505t1
MDKCTMRAPAVGDVCLRCPAADEAGVVVQGSVRSFRDWVVRTSEKCAGRGPTGWDWTNTRRRRAAALTREPWLSLEGDGGDVHAEVAYARTEAEANRTRAFAANAKRSPLMLFTCGLSEVDRREERSSRHATGRWANSFATEWRAWTATQETLYSALRQRARRLSVSLSSMRLVRWDILDPSSYTRPRANFVRALIFECGDLVIWDVERWELGVIARSCISVDQFGLPIESVV